MAVTKSPAGYGRSVVFGAAIDPAPDQMTLPTRQPFPGVGHLELGRGPALDQDVEIAGERVAGHDDGSVPGSFHDSFVRRQVEAAFLVALAFRLVAFDAIFLNDREDVVLEAAVFRPSRDHSECTGKKRNGEESTPRERNEHSGIGHSNLLSLRQRIDRYLSHSAQFNIFALIGDAGLNLDQSDLVTLGFRLALSTGGPPYNSQCPHRVRSGRNAGSENGLLFGVERTSSRRMSAVQLKAVVMRTIAPGASSRRNGRSNASV